MEPKKRLFIKTGNSSKRQELITEEELIYCANGNYTVEEIKETRPIKLTLIVE